MKNYSSSSEIKVGVVGYGGAFNMGRSHLQQMQAAGMTPVAVAEIDETRLQAAQEDFLGIQIFPTLDAMLESSPVDLVVFITPHNTHAPLALKALNAGRHVVCEKPLAITTAEVDAMIDAAQKHDVMISAYHNRHWDGRITQAVELVKNQKVIGDVVRIECHMNGYAQPGDWWRSSRTISGGILYDWGVHLLEYSLQLLDGSLTEVSGVAHQGFWAPQTAWKDDANEDEAFVLARFDSGQWLTLSISSIDSKGKDGWLEITGTRGTLTLDGATSQLIVQSEDGAKTETLSHPADEGQKYYDNVRDHLVSGAPLVISGEWARRPIHILDLAAQSSQQNRALPAKYA